MKSVYSLLSLIILINCMIYPVCAIDRLPGRLLDRAISETIMGEMGTPYATDFFGSCVDKHGFDSVSDIMAAFEKTKKCLGPVLYTQDGATFFSAILSLIMTKDKKDLCIDYAPEIKECINPPIDSMKACTGPVGHKDLESVKSAVSGAIDYACHDKGKRIKGFVKDEGFKCLIEQNGKVILDCFNKRSPLFAEMDKNVSIFSHENCRIHAASNKCIIDAYVACIPKSSPKAIEFVEGIINAAVIETPCSPKRATPNSSTSISGVSSVILLGLLTVIRIPMIHSI